MTPLLVVCGAASEERTLDVFYEHAPGIQHPLKKLRSAGTFQREMHHHYLLWTTAKFFEYETYIRVVDDCPLVNERPITCRQHYDTLS